MVGLIVLISGFIMGMTHLSLKIFAAGINPHSIIYKIFLAPNWLHYEIALFFIVIAVMIVTSTLSKEPDHKAIKGLYLGSATSEQKALTRASWNNWDLLFTGLIISAILAFYIYFW
jgi:solute:Na+ symporter, SSS family